MLFAVMVCGAAGGEVAMAQPATTQHIAVDLSTPVAAVQTMLSAQTAADTAALREVFYANSDADRDQVTAWAEVIAAGRRLRDAARDKFAPEPPGPAAAGISRDGILGGGAGAADQPSVANAQVQIDGDTATVQLVDRPNPIRLRMTDHQWRIDLSAFVGTSPAEQLDVNRQLAAAFNEAAGEIAEGKYASAQEAESAVQQKIHNIIAPQISKLSSTMPASTMPATQPTP